MFLTQPSEILTFLSSVFLYSSSFSNFRLPFSYYASFPFVSIHRERFQFVIDHR